MIKTIKNTNFFKNLTENFSVYLVGGCVRDSFLNVPCKDVDLLVCGVEMENLIIFLKNHGLVNLVGESFSVIKFKPFELDLKESIDIALPRKEIKTGNKHTDFKIISDSSITIEEDLFRRDFTINSMALDKNLNLIDPYNGYKDLKNKCLRMTNEKAFLEDSLRFMRCIRFAVKLGFYIETSTFEAIKSQAHTLLNISKERITDEFMKILGSDKPVDGVQFLIESRLIEFILPELLNTIGMSQNSFHSKDVFGHICDVITNAKPTAMHRLTALLHDIGKIKCKTVDVKGIVHFYGHEHESALIAEKFLKEHKFSTDQTELIVAAVEEHMMINKGCTKKTLRKKRMELGDEKWHFLLDLCETDRLSHVDADITDIISARVLTAAEPIIIKDKLVVSGQDIMDLFNLKPGKEVGKKLETVRSWILDNPTLTKEVILQRLTDHRRTELLNLSQKEINAGIKKTYSNAFATIKILSTSLDEKVLKSIDKQRKIKVFAKDNYTCKHCGEQGKYIIRGKFRKDGSGSSGNVYIFTKDYIPLTIDHIVPKSLGGRDILSNTQCLCAKCNTGKGNKVKKNEPLSPALKLKLNWKRFWKFRFKHMKNSTIGKTKGLLSAISYYLFFKLF